MSVLITFLFLGLLLTSCSETTTEQEVNIKPPVPVSKVGEVVEKGKVTLPVPQKPEKKEEKKEKKEKKGEKSQEKKETKSAGKSK